MPSGEQHPSVWMRPVRTPRVRRGQAFTRDDIAAAACAIADTDGLEALSMRRVAGALGITAMSLYWYVDTRDQILELMVDRIFSAQPPPVGEDWRARLADIGRATLARYRAHPWFVQAFGRPGSLPGLGQLRYWDTTVGALADPGLDPRLDPADVTFAVGTVNHFVSGYALAPVPGRLIPAGADGGVEDYLRDALVAGGLQHLGSLGEDAERFTDERFDRELGAVLDGIARGLVAGSASCRR